MAEIGRMNVRGSAELAARLLAALEESSGPDHGLAISSLEKAAGLPEGSLDRRTVYSVVDGLADAGVPVRRDAKPGMGNARYRLESRPFTKWEVSFLCDMVSASTALDAADKAALRRKLLGLLPEFERAAASRDVLSVDRHNRYRGRVEDNLEAIGAAMRARSPISFDYLEYDADGALCLRGGKRVDAEPYRIVYSEGCYYLVAGKIDGGLKGRTYRVDRMDAIESRPGAIQGSPEMVGIDLPQALEESFGMYLSAPRQVVRLEFDEDVAKSIADRFEGAAIVRAGEGIAQADVHVRASQNFYAWVLQFAGKVRITAPEAAIEGYADAISKVLGLNRAEGPKPCECELSDAIGDAGPKTPEPES